MREQDLVARFQTELRRRFRLEGKGSVERVQRQVGVGKGYFKSVWRKERQSFDLHMLFKAIEALKVEAGDFFVSVLGCADPVEVFRVEARGLQHDLRRQPPILARESAREPAERRTAERHAAAKLDLAELDGLRYEDPKKVLRRVRELIAEVDDRDLPRLLGAHASACRVAGRLDEAQMVLGRALDLAAEGGDAGVMVDLIQRSSYVAADRGHFRQALALAERATLGYSRLGDRLGLGKSLVEQGNWLFCLERLQPALEAYRSALRLLADDDGAEIRRFRFSALMNSGVIHRKLGRLDRAERCGLEAAAEADGVGRVLQGNLLAFQASVARDRGKVGRAADFLRRAIDAYGEISPLDTAFSVVQLCHLQLLQRQSSRAHQTAKLLLPLLERLEDNPLAASYVTELLRYAIAGRGLTAEHLQRIARGLRAARTQARRTR